MECASNSNNIDKSKFLEYFESFPLFSLTVSNLLSKPLIRFSKVFNTVNSQLGLRWPIGGSKLQKHTGPSKKLQKNRKQCRHYAHYSTYLLILHVRSKTEACLRQCWKGTTI